jgi:hypothetical protein
MDIDTFLLNTFNDNVEKYINTALYNLKQKIFIKIDKLKNYNLILIRRRVELANRLNLDNNNNKNLENLLEEQENLKFLNNIFKTENKELLKIFNNCENYIIELKKQNRTLVITNNNFHKTFSESNNMYDPYLVDRDI